MNIDYKIIDTQFIMKSSDGTQDSILITDIENPFYQYFEKGMETYSVINGSIEVITNGKRFILSEGDIINIEAWCPHKITFLDEATTLRQMNTARDGKICKMPVPVNITNIDKTEIDNVSANGETEYEFSTRGIKLMMKVGRWQLGGYREVWEYEIDKDYSIQCSNSNKRESIFAVKNGSFKIKMGNGFEIEAEKNDMICIPPCTKYGISATSDDSVIQDYNVSCHLFRLLEMVEAAQDYFPEKLEEKKYIDYLFEVNEVTNFVSFGK